jgi:type I restriction enzyme M protein
VAAKRKAAAAGPADAGGPAGNGMAALVKELWQAAVTLRGSIEPADYKRYVLPIIFLRFLSLRYERRRDELTALIGDPKSDYYKDKKALTDPDEYRSAGAFLVPEKARWENIVAEAQSDEIRTHLDSVLELLENKYPDKLRGLLPKIYATSNLSAENLRGLINLFSKDVFKRDHGGEDVIGRVYEYFIGEFANSEGKRGGEYFTPQSIVKTLVAMLEPTKGVVFDPCCGSGGMFVQSGAAEGPIRHRRGGGRVRTARRAWSRSIKAEMRAARPARGENALLDCQARLFAHAGTEVASVQ